MAKSRKSKADGAVPSPIDISMMMAPTTERDVLREKLVAIAREQIKTSYEYKRNRMDEVQRSIDLYNGKTKKALKGRWNVPLPLMSGFCDTLLSKTDDPPRLKVGYQDMADLRRAKKVQAKWDQDSSSVEGRWDEKDRQSKKFAFFYGYAPMKYFAYNDVKGEYRSHLEVVDPMDFECEPMGGQNLRDHKFLGQRNIFKTKSELEAMAMGESAIYDKKQVLRLVAAFAGRDNKEVEQLFHEKTDRMRSLGFDPERHSYVGQQIYNLTEWYMEFEGRWYYLFLEPHSGVCVRFEDLEDMFEGGHPFESWHTHPDPFNFYSKSPADDMRPVAESMNVLFNQMLDARERNIYAQRGYDPDAIDDPALLEWRPDGLIPIKTQDGTRPIGNSVYQFKVEGSDEQGTINLMQYMDEITGLKTGVTPSAQGESDEKRVGIYFGNLQQVADRLGLYNKAYSECWGRIGRLYYLGLRKHVKSNHMMVKMVGLRGYNWEELTEDDTNPTREFNLEVVGGQAQVQLDEIKKQQKEAALINAVKINPNGFNVNAVSEELLSNGGWEEGQIKRLMDPMSFGTDDMISIAEQAIQDIVYNEKEPKLYRKATFFFMQYILDKADELFDHEDVDLDEYRALLAYAQAHRDFAAYNAVKYARLQAPTAAPAEEGAGGRPAEDTTRVAVPGAPGGGAEGLGFSDVNVTPGGAEEAVRGSML